MKYPNIKLLLLVSMLMAFISCEQKKARKELSTEQIKAVDQLVEEAMIPGLQIGYFDAESETVYSSGFANYTDSIKVTDNTIFQANELGYTVITAICIRLQEENKLDLNQPISEDYQDTRLLEGTYNHLLTYQHLLSHTGGLPIWAAAEETIAIIDVPGETWNYSHLGYEWIMNALEAKFSLPIQELADQWVFQPLGITYSTFSPKTPSGSVHGHDLIGRMKNPAINNSQTFHTNVQDYLKLLNAFTGEFFQPASKQLLTKSLGKVSIWEDETTDHSVSWGPGLGIQSGSEGMALWQSSDGLSTKSFSIVYPGLQTGMVVLTNGENGSAIYEALAGMFFSHPLDALNWLDFETYESPSWKARRIVERSFAVEDSLTARNTYLQLLEAQKEVINDALINNVVWSFFETHQLDQAKRLATLHLEHFPNSANTFMRLGEVLGFQSEYEQSWLNYQRAMEIDPELSRLIMPRFPWYTEANVVRQEPQTLPLQSFIGSFGVVTIEEINNQLSFSDDEYKTVPLTRIGNTLFDLEGAMTFRLNFLLTGDQVKAIEKSFLSGERISIPKNPM